MLYVLKIPTQKNKISFMPSMIYYDQYRNYVYFLNKYIISNAFTIFNEWNTYIKFV